MQSPGTRILSCGAGGPFEGFGKLPDLTSPARSWPAAPSWSPYSGPSPRRPIHPHGSFLTVLSPPAPAPPSPLASQQDHLGLALL